MDLRHLTLICLGILIGAGVKSAVPTPQDKTPTVNDFPDLVGGLRATPGCIDVKASTLNDGKQLAVFAWFENKAAVQAWYSSPMHADAMKKFFPGRSTRPMSLSGFKDKKAPLLVVATVTPSNEPSVKGTPLAISQIAIEIYTPVQGGLVLGGSGFGPNNLKVPGLRRME